MGTNANNANVMYDQTHVLQIENATNFVLVLLRNLRTVAKRVDKAQGKAVRG